MTRPGLETHRDDAATTGALFTITALCLVTNADAVFVMTTRRAAEKAKSFMVSGRLG